MMNGKVHEDDREVAKMHLMIYSAKCIESKGQIRLGQSELQLSIKNIWCCILGNWRGDWLCTIIIEVLLAIM